MKLILLVTIVVFVTGSVLAQSAKQNDALEKKIRTLEQEEVSAILSGNFDKLDKLWAEDYTVNSPRNKVVKASTGPIRNGLTKYASFVREIEAVLISGNTVIVMGQETAKPISKAAEAEQIFRRRYTNVWMKRKGKWLLIARHANIICQT